jgi:uncharacterized membrane protein
MALRILTHAEAAWMSSLLRRSAFPARPNQRREAGGYRDSGKPARLLAARENKLIAMKMHHDNDSHAHQGRDRLAKSLGWFSIGLGLAEILAPRALARVIGVPYRPWLMALMGVREIASGLGILSGERPKEWLWSRVAGDVLDMSLLGAALASDDSEPIRVEVAAAAVLGVTALDVLAARQHENFQPEESAIHFRKTITINRSPEEVYAFWRNFENLPRFMHNLESVTTTGLTHSHWVAKGPAGKNVEWDAVITEDMPNRRIAWESVEGSEVENAGVEFETAPGQRGTILRVEMAYRPPGGKLGAAVAKLFGKAPEQEVQGDLYRFKQVLETGHVTTTEGQSAGRSTSTSPLFDGPARH